MSELRPIVILGPTAGGKSELAVGLAESLRPVGEIINADSMQVYRQMDAGTAKPSPALRARVPHHLIDIVEPTERFTVADWIERAEALIAALQARQVRPIVVGGTNLYLKALLEGLFPGPEGDLARRAELMQLPGEELHRRLLAVDPPAAQRIHPNDLKKLVRALEVYELTGKPISQWQTQWEGGGDRVSDLGSGGEKESARPREIRHPTPDTRVYRHNPILLGLDWPVEAISRRINARVKEMFHPSDGSESLPEEVRRLEAAGWLGPQAREALGYKQVLDHLQGRCTLEEAFERTKILTRRFAKTQRTWLRRYRGVHWLAAVQASGDEILAQSVALVRDSK